MCRLAINVAVALLLLFGGPGIGERVCAQWPNDASAPLTFGEMEIFAGGLQHATATTPDGATWITWIDSYCLGNFYVQRISPEGLRLQPGGLVVAFDDTCGFTEPPIITACSDNSVVLSRGASLNRAYRIAADGQMLWGPDGIQISQVENEFGAFGGMFGMPDGEVFVVWHSGTTMFAQRFAEGGNPAWPQSASIQTVTSSNRRIFAVVPDGTGGAIVFWDSPSSYQQLIFAVRFDSSGDAAWDEPLVVVPFGVGSSLHTDPVAISDGMGGAFVAYTEGLEQTDIASRLFLHHVSEDGDLTYPQPGVRVSEELSRQYDSNLRIDDGTGDVFVYWRDGGFDAQSINAQRMTLAGDRLWGDQGIEVTPITVSTSRFSAEYNGSVMVFGVSDSGFANAASVNVYRVSDGGMVGQPIPISGELDSGFVQTTLSAGGAVVVSWQRLVNDPAENLAAQRLNRFGTLEQRRQFRLRAGRQQ